MSGKRPFPGYGRGWGEEKATGIVARFFQRMREPATSDDYIIGATVVVIGLMFVLIIFGN